MVIDSLVRENRCASGSVVCFLAVRVTKSSLNIFDEPITRAQPRSKSVGKNIRDYFCQRQRHDGVPPQRPLQRPPAPLPPTWHRNARTSAPFSFIRDRHAIALSSHQS